MEMIKSILVPTDFSNNSKAAINYAVELAMHFGSKLYLIYVIEPAIYPADFSMGQIALPSIESEMNQRAEEELKNISRNEIVGNLEVDTIISTGKPFVEIIQAASEKSIDLIVIATHGHTGVEHLLFGSTAEKVVRKAPCPVLTVRQPLKGFKYNPGNTEQ